MPSYLYKEKAEQCLKDFCMFINLRHFDRVGTKSRLIKHARMEMRDILATVAQEIGDRDRTIRVAQMFYCYCWDTEFIDPPSSDIDSCNGYLRDERVLDSRAAAARRALRLDLRNQDKMGAGVSVFIKGLNPKGKTEKQMKLHTEHVLEISVVAHMINNPRFLERAKREFGEKFPAGGFDLATIAKLAATLREGPNLVQSVPKWFNDAKSNFFKGGVEMSIYLAQYLEERSSFQAPWIKRHAENGDPYMRFIFKELSNSRFAKGNWGQLIYSKWVPEEASSLKEFSEGNDELIWQEEEDPEEYSEEGNNRLIRQKKEDSEEDEGDDDQCVSSQEEESEDSDSDSDAEWTPPEEEDSSSESDSEDEEESLIDWEKELSELWNN